MEPDYKDILVAQERVREAICPSPLIRSGYYSRVFGTEIFFKLESLQETGSGIAVLRGVKPFFLSLPLCLPSPMVR